ncbi:hypothetical protein D3C87_1414110 [compost metagenome]
MQVVHRADARQGQEGGVDLGHVQTVGRGVQRQIDRVLQQAPGPGHDDGDDQQADHSVDHGPAGQQDDRPGDHHAQRDPRIGHHVQIGPAHVQILVLVLHEQQGRAQVDEETDARHDHDDAGRHRRGFGQTAHGLEGDGPAGEDQQQGVAQGRQHRRLAEAIGALGPRRPVPSPARQPGRAAGHGQPQNVRQVVPRIGHQGRRIGPEARPELADHKGQVDDQANGVAPVARVHRPMMVAADPVGMAAMIMTRMIVAAVQMVVCVIVRHATPLGPPAAPRQRQRT